MTIIVMTMMIVMKPLLTLINDNNDKGDKNDGGRGDMLFAYISCVLLLCCLVPCKQSYDQRSSIRDHHISVCRNELSKTMVLNRDPHDTRVHVKNLGPVQAKS